MQTDTIIIFVCIIIFCIVIARFVDYKALIAGAIAMFATKRIDQPEQDNVPSEVEGAAENATTPFRQYMQNNTINIVDINTDKLDTKKINAKGLKQAFNKRITADIFVDKLVNSTLVYLYSLDKSPTDLALDGLSRNNKLIEDAAILIDKKYPDSNITPADLREFHKNVTRKIREVQQTNITKLGDISREDLIIKYLIGVNTSDNQCQADLKTLRYNNEQLRDELRRGLTNYTADALLRDCREEKERLSREIYNNKASDNKVISDLRQQVQSLTAIANELHQSAGQAGVGNSAEIARLQRQLSECEASLGTCIDEAAGISQALDDAKRVAL